MKALLYAALVLMAIPAEAAERPRIPAVLDEMLKLSGIEERLARLPEAMMDVLGDGGSSGDAGGDKRLRDIVRQSYRREVTYPAFVAAVAERYEARQARTVVETLRAPLFRRLQALENDAIAPGALARLNAFSEQLVDDRPGVDRHLLIRRLDAASGASAVNLEILASTVAAFGAMLPAQGSALRDVRAAVKEQSVVGVKNHVLLTLLYAYRSASDEELREYADFWESSPGRWYVGTMNGAVVRAMTRAAEMAVRTTRQRSSAGERLRARAGRSSRSAISSAGELRPKNGRTDF